MNRSRFTARRAAPIAAILAIAVGASSLTSGCAISVEQEPRPITRETTVPTTVDGN